eukprot:1139770-Pelagomonas_calceolata.AAC.3
MRFGDSSGDCCQSLGWRGFYMGPEVRVLVQHFSHFPSGTPCDINNFMFFREVVSCLFFVLGQGSACRAVPVLMGFAQYPVLLGAYFDFYEASPVICTVACITGGQIIIMRSSTNHKASRASDSWLKHAQHVDQPFTPCTSFLHHVLGRQPTAAGSVVCFGNPLTPHFL